MRSLLLLAHSVFFSLVACGPAAPPPTCSSATCDGCCDVNNVCVRAVNDQACGIAGSFCRVCGSGEACTTGACLPRGVTNGGGSAAGGVAGGSAGGNAGGAAGGNAGGSVSGGGSGGGTVTCSPVNCTGCCRADGRCEVGLANGACGAQGQSCRDCASAGTVCSQTTRTCVGAGGGAAGGSAEPRMRVFLTSTQYTGALTASAGLSNALAAADALCNLAAQASNKGGTWKAFLSTSTTSAFSRIADVGPWVQERPGQPSVVTFNNKANLATSPLEPITYDEQGGFGEREFWTGSTTGGMPSSASCSDFTSSFSSNSGAYGVRDSLAYTTGGCSTGRSLLCFEQDKAPLPVPRAPTGKRLFLTRTQYTGSLTSAGGMSNALAAADALCNLAAQASNKGGTWKAFLSTSTTSAFSRIADVGPWVQERPGQPSVVTFNNKANLATSPLEPITYDEQGGFGEREFWTGSTTGGMPSSASCSDFTSSFSSNSGAYGVRDSLAYTTGGCSTGRSLLCFEQ